MKAESYLHFINQLLENKWLEEGGNLIIEHQKTIDFKDHPRFTQHKKYGNVHFSFFE